MDTLTVHPRDQEADAFGPETTDERLPRRPRRQLFNRRSALAALLTCAAGFYAGVRVEKGQLASTPGTVTLPSGGTAGAPGASGGARTAAAGGRGTAGGGGFAGAAGRGLAGAAGANASFGTVQSVNGNTLVLSEASGNTVKVALSPSTKVTKNVAVKHSAVRPGDTIIVQGAANRKGTLVAATVTDSGAGRSGSGAGGSSSGGSSSGSSSPGGGSAVGSLFSSGGGG